MRVVPLLNDDVQAYTEMVTATIASLPRVASESVPRKWWTRRATIGGLLLVFSLIVVASMQLASLQSVVWGDNVPAGAAKVKLAGGALLNGLFGALYSWKGPLV